MIRCILFTILLFSIGVFASKDIRPESGSPLSKIQFNPDETRVMKTQSHETESTGFTCLDNTRSCSDNGQCNADHDNCICDNGYTTHECGEGHKCCYKQKSFTAALVLQCIPITAQLGIGFFIIDQVAWGLAMLGLTTGGFLIIAILLFFVDEAIGTLWLGLCECAMLGIYISGIVLIATGDMKDGNGVALS